MKKILNVYIVLMLLASVTSLALAEDGAEEVEIDEETQKEAEIMANQLGSEIRLLQLEKAITKNIIKAEEVISVLKELDYNTTVLEAILAELELLKEEVMSADPNSTNATQDFIDLKRDAKELTEDFRNTVRDMLDDEELEGLQERIREMVCEQVQNLSEKIQNKIRLYNRNQLHRIYGVIGETNDSLLNKYQNGNVTMDPVKQQISEMVNQMTKEKRYDIFSQLKQDKIQSQIQARNCVENATEGFQERNENRIRNRIQNSENMPDDPVREEMEQRMRNRLNENDDGPDPPGDNGDNQQSGGGGNQ